MDASIRNHLKSVHQKQVEFFQDKSRNFLMVTEYASTATSDPSFFESIEGQIPSRAFPYSNWPYSYEFIRDHAFDLGRQYVKLAEGAAKYHSEVGDDWIPYIWITWGTGGDASLITGRNDVIFQDGASYSAGHIIHDWDDLAKLTLDLDNFWISKLRDFWKGVESSNPNDGLALCPYQFRSPLDFAMDMRGTDLFTDMYEYPEEVIALISFCADCILQIDEHLREEFPILQSHLNGTWGLTPGKKAMWLNGDPIDLISEKFVEKFNNPSIEKLTDYADGVFFHHHSIGHQKAGVVSKINNLAVQQILQDPNGPRLLDVINDDLIEASLNVPVRLDANLVEAADLEATLEKLSGGRFILYVGYGEDGVYDKESIKKYREILGLIRKKLNTD